MNEQERRSEPLPTKILETAFRFPLEVLELLVRQEQLFEMAAVYCDTLARHAKGLGGELMEETICLLL